MIEMKFTGGLSDILEDMREIVERFGGNGAGVEPDREFESPPTHTPPPGPPLTGDQPSNTTPGQPLDDKNRPWIEALHSGGQTKTQDGLWKRKRGVTAEQVDAHFAALQSPTAAPPLQQPGNPPLQQPPVAAPVSIQQLTTYFAKIQVSGKAQYPDIQAFLASLGVSNLVDVPDVNIPGYAEQIREKFGVDF